MSDRIDKLLIKCLQGIADDHEYETAFYWIHSDNSNLVYYSSLREAWIVSGIVKSKEDYDYSKAWKIVSEKTRIKRFGFVHSRIISGWKNIAAFLILILVFFSGAVAYRLVYSNRLSLAATEYIVSAAPGSRTHIILPDSTEVWLGSGSTLGYSADYNITGRSVDLCGKAYFKVKSNNKLSFRVNASEFLINSQDSDAFIVKDFRNSDYAEVILVSGLISVEQVSSDPEIEEIETIFLQPDQKALYISGETEIVVNDLSYQIILEDTEKISNESIWAFKNLAVKQIVETNVYLSWVYPEKIADIVNKVKRLFDDELFFINEGLEYYDYSELFHLTTLEEILSELSLVAPFEFDLDNNTFFLSLN